MNNTGTVLALITAQYSCERIINFAKEQAQHLSMNFIALTVQPTKADAKKRAEDMICLTNLSKKCGCDIRIVYSNNPLKSIISETGKISPAHIYIGQGSEKSQFLTNLRLAPIGAPISVIGADNIIYTLPSVTEDLFNIGNNKEKENSLFEFRLA